MTAPAPLEGPRAARPVRRLHVGVLGLGRRWRSRYRPALLALSDRFAIRAVCDPIAARAAKEARELQCAAVAGPVALLENPAIDALLLLEAPWYRLWPIEVACRAGKPVFSAPVAALAAESAPFRQQVRDCRLPVMMGLAPRLAGPTLRVQELLRGPLGPARVVTVDYLQPLDREPEPGALLGPAGPAVLDWCLAFFDQPPASVQAIRASAGLASVLVEFADGRAAQVVRRQGSERKAGLRLEIVTANGTAGIDLPDRLRWRTRTSQHLERLARCPPLARVLLEHFHQAVTERQAPQPGLDDAWMALRCLDAAKQSAPEGRRIILGDSSAP
jgi:predicted dehydrogenase